MQPSTRSGTRGAIAALHGLALAAAVLATQSFVAAQPAVANHPPAHPAPAPRDSSGERPASRRSVALTLDNDVLTVGKRDSDYTGGLSVTCSADREAGWTLLPTAAWRWLDALVPAPANRSQARTVDALQFGLMAFTPKDVRASAPLPLERPYASLLFATASSTHVTAPHGPAYTASVTVGVMGLELAGSMQRALHKSLRQQKIPQGWAHQISAGGEPTAGVGWARQALLFERERTPTTRTELKWRSEVNLGYLTEGSLALAGRWGRIDSPWWGFGSERTDYATQSVPMPASRSGEQQRELYLWAGLRVRARAYNALLQGQWRSSEVTVASSRLHHLLAEASVGVTWRFTPHWRLSYLTRFQTPEIRDGPGRRELMWAGLTLTRDL